jgi:hypothetical protein
MALNQGGFDTLVSAIINSSLHDVDVSLMEIIEGAPATPLAIVRQALQVRTQCFHA